MNGTRIWPAVTILLTIALLGSLALNTALYRLAVGYYAKEQSVRLDPLSHKAFVASNDLLAPPDSDRPRIVLTGDSRVAQWLPLPGVPGAEFINRGRGGDTTRQVLLRLPRDVIALQPEVALIQCGINDLKVIGVYPEASETIQKDCVDNLREMVRLLTDAEIDVILLTVFPAGPIELARRPLWSEQVREAIGEVNAELSSWNNEYLTVVDCTDALAEALETRREFALDAFHLTTSGYEALNTLIAPQLQARLQKKGRQD